MSFQDLHINHWQACFRGVRLAVSIGRGGIGIKQGEGDQRTPIGYYRIVAVLYRADKIRLHNPKLYMQPLRRYHLWSDDPCDPDYNQCLYGIHHPYSYESLYRSDHVYDIIGVLDFNYPQARPGAGSAIFIHVWRQPRYPTTGCVAFALSDLIWIVQNWTTNARVIIQ